MTSVLSARFGEITLAGQSSIRRLCSASGESRNDFDEPDAGFAGPRICWTAGPLFCCSAKHNATPREEEAKEEEKYKGDDVNATSSLKVETVDTADNMLAGYSRPEEDKDLQQSSMKDVEDVRSSPQPVNERERRWVEKAEKGQLDVYTCLALRRDHKVVDRSLYRSKTTELLKQQKEGAEAESQSTMRFTVIALLALQVLVPLLMLAHQLKNMPTYAKDAQVEFRIVGFILYLYSIRNMFYGASDECRAIYLEMCFEFNLPWPNLWPAVLGEIVNAFAAFTLTVTLFTVFCTCSKLQDLVINCVAINFIGSVDSEFTTDVMKDVAVDNFHKLARTYKNTRGSLAAEMEDSLWRTVLEKGLAYLLFALRIGGTLCCGVSLGLMFMFSHFTLLCGTLGIKC